MQEIHNLIQCMQGLVVGSAGLCELCSLEWKVLDFDTPHLCLDRGEHRGEQHELWTSPWAHRIQLSMTALGKG